MEEPDVERLLHRPAAQPEVRGEELQRAHAVALREHRLVGVRVRVRGKVRVRVRVRLKLRVRVRVRLN